MKKIVLFSTLLLTLYANSFAQSSSTSYTEQTTEKSSYSHFVTSYNPFEINASAWIFNRKIPFYGVSIEYMKGFNAKKLFSSLIEDTSSKFPLYFELGMRLNYGWHNSDDGFFSYEDNTSFEENTTPLLLGLSIPFNLACKIIVPNSEIALIPFAGVNARVNILCGRGGLSPGSYYYDVFEEVDDFKRFQWGYQLGINLGIKNIVLGIQRVTDLSNFYIDNDGSTMKLSQKILSLGVTF